MNLSRLMILGLLTERGPLYGHQIRRAAELTNVETWGGITGGALYRELHRLEDAGLIRPLRAEQEGRRPARTVYGITEEGGLELAVQREAALESLFESADPVAVVLLFASGGDLAALRARLLERRSMVAARLESMTSERVRLTGQGFLSPLAIAAFRRGELRLEAELLWHEEVTRQVAEDAVPPIAAPLRSLGTISARWRTGSGRGGDSAGKEAGS